MTDPTPQPNPPNKATATTWWTVAKYGAVALVMGGAFLFGQWTTPTPTPPAPPPVPVVIGDLTVDGRTKLVQVDKVVVTKEERLLVSELPFTIKAVPGAFDYRWSFPNTITALDMGDTLKVTAAPKGELTVGVVVKNIDFDKRKVDTKFSSLSLLIGEVPPGPVPPGPVPPGPTPPGPNPPAPPAPIAEKGFRVMIVYESADRLSAAQTAIFTSKDIHDYLNLRCIDDPDGKAWRQWDKDTPTEGVRQMWKDAFARVKASEGPYPKILISNGVTGFVGPLPRNVPDTLELLKQYGGV